VADSVTTSALAALLEEDAAELYEDAPCGYLSVSGSDWLVLRVNATFERMIGRTRTTLVQQMRLSDLFTVGGRIFFETHLRPLLGMQGFVREIALDLACADGGTLPVIMNAREKRREDASVSVVRITVFDATDRRRYERELLAARRRAEDAAKARSDLISMVSHDVRAPLSALLTAAALLDTTPLTAQQIRYANIVKSSATHALTLLNSILDLSALEGGHAGLRPRPFDLAELLGEIISGGRLAAAHKPQLVVRLDIDVAAPTALVGDRDKLGQVLTNLVTNAVKFTEQGSVTLLASARQVQEDSAAIEFIVSDTGIGIPADRLPVIFDEFTQASDDIAGKFGGSGLGLAICRKLLALFGASLTVTSTVGQGTTFSFIVQLPRQQPE
jgi:signal transduction histidine kinase